MWKIYRYAEQDIVDLDNCVIYPKDTWYLVGDYNSLEAVTEVVKHEIYLYNCSCKDGDPNPKFKIVSDFE